MIQSIRKLFQSRIGVVLALAFLALIALAFASADITGGTFGGVVGGERVATVGDERISTSEYRDTLNGAFEQSRANNPTLTMADFLKEGAADGVLDQMSERLAIYAFAHQQGVRIGDPLIGSELTQIPAFQGPDGKFSQKQFDAMLGQRGISEKLLRSDIKQGLAARIMLLPAQIGSAMPEKVAMQYARLLNETRKGWIGIVPSAVYARDVKVTDKILTDYLATNRARYSLPERRTVRYAVIDDSIVSDVTVTDAEIAAAFKQDAAKYAGREERTLTQLVLPTEAAAKAVLAELANPATMGSVASSKGLATAQLSATSQTDLSAQTSLAVAKAAYGAENGAIAGPVRGPLGWYLLRVDSVTAVPAKTLASVREEIVAALTDRKRKEVLADRAASAEEQLNDGASLADVAGSLKAEVKTSEPVLADGRPYGTGAPLPAPVQRVASAVFQMSEDSDAQIAIAADGSSYILYAPGTITRSAPPPFAEIKARLDRDYRLEQGSKLAKAAADKVLAAMKKGETLSGALASLKKPMPPVDKIVLTRQQLMSSGQQIPPPLALMFTMAKGSVKKLEAPQNQGWMIIDLDTIDTPAMKADDPLVQATRTQLGPVMGGELGQQLSAAIRADVGVKRNETAIKAVTTQLTGGNR